MRKFDLSLRSSRSSYFATFRHQLTILSKTDALDEEKWLNMLGTFVKDWFRYESHFVHGRDSLVDILKERGLLSESDAVQPLIGKKSSVKLLNNPYVSRPLGPLLTSFSLLPFCISEERFSRNAATHLVCRPLPQKNTPPAPPSPPRLPTTAPVTT